MSVHAGTGQAGPASAPPPWPSRAAVLALVLALLVAGCMGSGGQDSSDTTAPEPTTGPCRLGVLEWTAVWFHPGILEAALARNGTVRLEPVGGVASEAPPARFPEARLSGVAWHGPAAPVVDLVLVPLDAGEHVVAVRHTREASGADVAEALRAFHDAVGQGEWTGEYATWTQEPHPEPFLQGLEVETQHVRIDGFVDVGRLRTVAAGQGNGTGVADAGSGSASDPWVGRWAPSRPVPLLPDGFVEESGAWTLSWRPPSAAFVLDVDGQPTHVVAGRFHAYAAQGLAQRDGPDWVAVSGRMEYAPASGPQWDGWPALRAAFDAAGLPPAPVEGPEVQGPTYLRPC